MNVFKKQSAILTLSTYFCLISTAELQSVTGGIDSFGNSMEIICRFLQKLIYGN